MRKIITILIICTLAPSLFGCSSSISRKVSDVGSNLESKLSASADSAQSRISDVVSGTQIIGNEDYGYMRIPSDFKKLENTGTDDLQYSNQDGTVVFTLNKFSSDIPASSAAEGVIENFKQNGGEDINSDSDAIINGLSGSEINCYFPNEKRYATVYLIPFMEKTAYVAMEYTGENEPFLAYIQSWQNYEFNE